MVVYQKTNGIAHDVRFVPSGYALQPGEIQTTAEPLPTQQSLSDPAAWSQQRFVPIVSSEVSTNWIRNSHWRYTPATSFATSNGLGSPVATPASPDPLSNTIWWHGPGIGGATTGSFPQAIQGEWRGNPEKFLRITWVTAPTAGDPVYQSFRFTFLEHWINTGRLLAGKQVTVSWQLRCPVGGVPVIPIIWWAIPNQPENILTGPTFTLDSSIQRCDFTTILPAIPAGVDVTPGSYLGVGLDMPGRFGPTIDIGPSRFNEGGPQDFDETPWWLEKLLAAQPYSGT